MATQTIASNTKIGTGKAKPKSAGKATNRRPRGLKSKDAMLLEFRRKYPKAFVVPGIPVRAVYDQNSTEENLPFANTESAWNPQSPKHDEDAFLVGYHHAAHYAQFLAAQPDASMLIRIVCDMAARVRVAGAPESNERHHLAMAVGFCEFLDSALREYAKTHDVFQVADDYVLLDRACRVMEEAEEERFRRAKSLGGRIELSGEDASAIYDALMPEKSVPW